jgi:hypothetical protein
MCSMKARTPPQSLDLPHQATDGTVQFKRKKVVDFTGRLVTRTYVNVVPALAK